MDQLDRSIINALQRDGALSHAALAEQVGASQAACWRRVKALETAGVLGPIVRLVEPQMVHLTVTVICQVRLKNHLPENTRQFEAFVATQPEIMECYSMSGEWDYHLRVVAKDIGGYETFLMRHLLPQASVATASSHFALRGVKYTTALPIP
jgi:Lrp/AsnC family transcriptional regulator